MIHYTYSNHSPIVQRLQGGILYPHNIEQVEVTSEEGAITQYRYKLLKFKDDGSDFPSDPAEFQNLYGDQIQQYLNEDVDVQRKSPRHPDWPEISKFKGLIPEETVDKLPFEAKV